MYERENMRKYGTRREKGEGEDVEESKKKQFKI